MSNYTDGKLDSFDQPTSLPESEEQEREWQERSRAWWEQNPMRYDWRAQIDAPEFSKEFYQEIDRRFFGLVKQFMPWRERPFDPLIDYEGLRGKDVLEIGVGNGSAAQLLASASGSFTGIDLTEYAVRSTSRRLEAFDLRGRIRQMDAEQMDLGDEEFDQIWSWGVVHHSSNPGKILKEMWRVLRPGGRAITMVYHRTFWNYWICAGLMRGVLMGRLRKLGSVNAVLQEWTDGALARFYTISEWRTVVSEFFDVEEVRIFGLKSEVVPLPGSRAKSALMSLMPDPVARFLTNRLRLGTFLVTVLNVRK